MYVCVCVLNISTILQKNRISVEGDKVYTYYLLR
jgi:hypothetical protein